MPVDRLRELVDPTVTWPWNSVPMCGIPVEQVLAVPPAPGPLTVDEQAGIDPWPHVARIGHFVRRGTGWDDPLEVDVGCLGWAPDWPLLDGNHRFYAVILNGDETVLVDVAGDVAEAERLLRPVRSEA